MGSSPIISTKIKDECNNIKEVAYVIAKRTKQQSKLKNKHKPKIFGKSTDGKNIIGNLFFIIESRGVLLEDAINLFYSNNYLIDWISFYEDGVKKGWNDKTILMKIGYAFDESNYLEYKSETLIRLRYYISKK